MPTKSEERPFSVSTGTYFGECLVYCNEEITITREMLRYALTSPVKDEDCPDIMAETSTERDEWEQLTNLIDLDGLRALPRTIGHPDHADAGGEWIAVFDGASYTRVDFDFGASVPQISALLDFLRKIRKRLSQKYRP